MNDASHAGCPLPHHRVSSPRGRATAPQGGYMMRSRFAGLLCAGVAASIGCRDTPRRRRMRRTARTAASSTRSIATTTTISSPMRRPIRANGKIPRRWYSPTRRSRIPPSISTCSGRSPIICEVHRQARGLLSGAVELGADRSDAVRPPAHRRLLHRPDRIRRQPRGRRPVRDQGHREGAAGLST